MNNAATSWPKAPGVAERIVQRLEALPGHAHRTGFDEGDGAEDCRGLIAELMRVRDVNRIAYSPNATHALNAAIHGFRAPGGARVVTTEAEHNSVYRPLHYLLERGRIACARVPVDASGRVIPEEWKKAVNTGGTALAVFSHASNVTGAVNDAALLCAIAREAGAAVLIDASQSFGVVDVLPEAWGADLVAFTGHKYLLGPPGTGGLYVRPGTDLTPVWVGGTGIRSDSDEMPQEMPLRLEAGTPNDASFAGLAAALAWRRGNPQDTDAMAGLTGNIARQLTALGANVVHVDGQRTPVVSFTLPGWDVEDAGEALQKCYRIVCRTGLHCAPRIHAALGTAPQGTVRVSLSRFTSQQEAGYLIESVREMLR